MEYQTGQEIKSMILQNEDNDYSATLKSILRESRKPKAEKPSIFKEKIDSYFESFDDLVKTSTNAHSWKVSGLRHRFRAMP